MRQIALINLENVSDEVANSYRTRNAARAVAFDKENKVALLHSIVNNYYKLPGGGVEKGEQKEDALLREGLEEIGFELEIIGEIGIIVEYRSEQKLKQVSYCYFAKTVGEEQPTALEEGELAEGFVTVWLPLPKACEVISESRPTTYEGPYMVARDTAFLNAALEHLNESGGI